MCAAPDVRTTIVRFRPTVASSRARQALPYLAGSKASKFTKEHELWRLTMLWSICAPQKLEYLWSMLPVPCSTMLSPMRWIWRPRNGAQAIADHRVAFAPTAGVQVPG